MAQGGLHNIAFGDMMNLTEGFGFRLMRVAGSHHILANPDIRELVNIQSVGERLNPTKFGSSFELWSDIT